MRFRPVKDVIDIPTTQHIEDPQMGISIDYMFMGMKLGKQGVNLLLETTIIDHQENRYIRRTEHLLMRREVKDCIRTRIEEHLIDVGVDNIQVKGLMRYFEVDNSKCKPYDTGSFNRNL